MLDVTRLRVLVAVARCGSVTAAAQALHYAQPSVSHHLARLEAETGSRLIQRAGRGIRLTDAGRMLAERAEEILGRLDAAEAELAAHTGLRSGRVRLAAFPSALGTFVPAAAAGFVGAHPGIDLRFTEAEPPAAVRLLRSGEVEVALLFTYPGETVPDLDGLRPEPLLEERLYLVTPGDRAGDTLADHRDRPWISGCERCRAELLRVCAAAGFTPDIRFTTDDYVAVQALVAAGLGVTVLPALALAAHQDPGVRTVALPDTARTVYAAVYGDTPDPPGTTALLGHLRAAAGLPAYASIGNLNRPRTASGPRPGRSGW
ncbi:LysR family transcriptional regulator [Actinoplanes sp. SE50]|uniref:LysR family transcriptional regulator n=1 Tax=unclassified Actinoplanes TaxID=2626549 RepID=UPI00023EC526|nr:MULTISPECIES: LysR family transcriptional regulator [unclassified Actinoplanes]AEV88041.1 putative RuBisCO transcriptional regulator [Actinoplanes sp. SE50/110]ATO86445.1 LysR family transcriptional regulator [Actinoplanes sp. SE50]SLM03860.1 LysR-family transcriptional regulator [Actinoplanes sp. SE50/110]